MEQQALQRLQVLTHQLTLVSSTDVPAWEPRNCLGRTAVADLCWLDTAVAGQWRSRRAHASGKRGWHNYLYAYECLHIPLVAACPTLQLSAGWLSCRAAAAHPCLVPCACRTALLVTRLLTRGATPLWMMWSSLQPCGRLLPRCVPGVLHAHETLDGRLLLLPLQHVRPPSWQNTLHGQQKQTPALCTYLLLPCRA